MNYIGMNSVAIGAATAVGLLVGVAHHMLSGLWRERGARQTIALAFIALVAEFWLASILAGALILAPVQANAWTIAIGTAIVIWIGFVVPVLAVSYGARGLKASLLTADCAHWLLVMGLQAATLHAVGLSRP